MIKTYATHFCGVGGACAGLHQAGLECKLAIDYVDFIVKARLKNTGHQALCMNVADYEPKDEHAADFFWTSPPCQTFSTAARDDYFKAINAYEKNDLSLLEKMKEDARHNLFMASVNYVKWFMPKFVVLENVMGLLTHDDVTGQNSGTFSKMMRTFSNLGYNVEWDVLNSLEYGLCQDRDRVFIVCSRDGHKGLIPMPTTPLKDARFGSIMDRYTTDGAWAGSTYQTAVEKVKRTNVEITVVTPDDVLPTITCGWGGGPTRKKVAILDSTKKGLHFLRNPTVAEGARAQGFPKEWTYPDNLTQAWTLIGNAVSSPVARALAEHLIALDKGERPAYRTSKWSPRIPQAAKYDLPPPDMFAEAV
jgi:DNA-cytosine methyltransferase